MRPYNQGSDFPTLLALIVAVGFPLLLLSLVFDIFPRERIDRLMADLRVPWSTADARPSPSPVAAAVPSPAAIRLTIMDWEIPNGHFFTQTNGQPALTSATGYAVTNSSSLAFWDEFQKLGGPETVGFPLSNRFTYKGFTIQIFQKLVFQGPETGGEVQVLNLLDELSAAGKDEVLKEHHFTPLPLGPEFDAGKSPEQIPAARLELLSGDQAIESFYRGSTDPIRRFGLPTSTATDMGDYLVALRCQRAVIQHWKKDMPWAKAGDVTLANMGQIAIEVGLFPTEGLRPTFQAPPQSEATPIRAPSPAPKPAR